MLFRGELADDVAENPLASWASSRAKVYRLAAVCESREALSEFLPSRRRIVEEPIEIRRHFRELITVHDETGKPMISMYDPRVITQYLPTCNAEELDIFFGSIDAFVAETENGDNFSIFAQKTKAR